MASPEAAVPLVLESERLRLRCFARDDLGQLHEIKSDPEVTRYMLCGRRRTESATAEFIQSVMAQYEPGPNHEFAIERKADGRLIGSIGLTITSQAHKEAEIGFCLRRDEWGKGYATEAARRLLDHGFRTLALHRVWATCRPANTASAHVLEKLGMRREGSFRKHRFAHGQWQDSLYYAILEEEWPPSEAARRTL